MSVVFMHCIIEILRILLDPNIDKIKKTGKTANIPHKSQNPDI